MTSIAGWCSLQAVVVNNKMYCEVLARAIISIRREQAWELLRDLSLAHNYVPGVIETQITTTQKEGMGASRKVYQGKTSFINETVEEWNDGYGFLIRIHCGNAGPPFPFQEAWFRYEIGDADRNTQLTTSLIYVVRWGKFGRILNRILLQKFITKRIRDVALSLKIYYETRERVTPDKLKRARKGEFV